MHLKNPRLTRLCGESLGAPGRDQALGPSHLPPRCTFVLQPARARGDMAARNAQAYPAGDVDVALDERNECMKFRFSW